MNSLVRSDRSGRFGGVPFRDNISYKQAKNAVLIAFLLGMIFSAAQIFLDLQKEKQLIGSTVQQVLHTLQDTGAEATFSLNKILAQKTVNGLFAYKPIFQAIIRDDLGTVVAHDKRPQTSGRFRWLTHSTFGDVSKFTQPLTLHGKTDLHVGEITVWVDVHLVAANFLDRVGMVLLFGMLRNFILALILTGLFFLTFTQPLVRVVKALQAIRHSSRKHYILQAPIPKGHEKDELGLLVQSINALTTEVHKNEEQLRSLLISTGEGIYGIDLDGACTFCNPACLKILKYQDESQLLGKNMHDLIHHTKVDGTPYLNEKCLIYQAFRKGEGVHVDNEVLWRADGSCFHAEYRSFPMRRSGYVIGAVVSFTDITLRKQAEEMLQNAYEELERRVQERTSELSLANKELESFAYTVSHDLRAPLRALDGFSQILIEDYNDIIDEEGKLYLQNLRQSSQEMSALIDGLLMLSRSIRGDMKRTRLNLSNKVQEIILSHKSSEPERDVIFDVLPNISAHGDPSLIKTLLENLVGNAWKYSSTTAQARIEFGTEQKDGEKVFYIKDNGAGFDMTYADKLYQPFQRLHKSGEFEGIGIGLATVQRIVHRHGGWIRAESEVGKGATFYFTLASKKVD